MSSRRKKSSSKPVPQHAILVDRRALLSVIGLSTMILDAMSDEYQRVKESKAMDKEVKLACRQVISAHIQNMAQLGAALSNCVIDLDDIEGVRMPNLN